MTNCNLGTLLGNVPNCHIQLGSPTAMLLYKEPTTVNVSDLNETKIQALVESGDIVGILKNFDDFTPNNTEAAVTTYAGSGRSIITSSQKINGNLIFGGDPCMAKTAVSFEGKQLHVLIITTNNYAVGKETGESATIATIPITFGATSVDSPVFNNTGDNNITITYSLGDVQQLLRRLKFIPTDVDATLISGKDVVKLYDITATTAKIVSDCDGSPYDIESDTPTLSAKVNGVAATANLTSSENGSLQYTITPAPTAGDTLGLQISGAQFGSDWQYAKIVTAPGA